MAASMPCFWSLAGHDLLAGARLAGEHDRRLGGRHLRRQGEDVLPELRVAEDAAGAAARLELLLERLDALLELRGALAGLRGLALLLGQVLVGEREAHV